MWSDLWPLLITAALTLAVTLMVQFYAVPRVETRKRREDRWERDLLALGELLTFEQRTSAELLYRELWWRRFVADISSADDIDETHAADMKKEHEERLRDRLAQYRREDTRVDWLADRVCAIDAFADAMHPFVKARHQYASAQRKGLLLAYTPLDEMPSTEEIDEFRDAERAAVRSMVKAIKSLIGHPPPRTPLRRRARQRAQQWVSFLQQKLRPSKKGRAEKARAAPQR